MRPADGMYQRFGSAMEIRRVFHGEYPEAPCRGQEMPLSWACLPRSVSRRSLFCTETIMLVIAPVS